MHERVQAGEGQRWGESESESESERERERERESPAGSTLSAQSPAGGSGLGTSRSCPELREIKSRMLNQQSQPGAPVDTYF